MLVYFIIYYKYKCVHSFFNLISSPSSFKCHVLKRNINHPLVSWSSSSSSSLVSTCPSAGWTNMGGERLLSTKLSCMEKEFRKDILSSPSEKPGLSPPPRKLDDGAWNLSCGSGWSCAWYCAGCRDWRWDWRDCCSNFSISFTENGVDVIGLGSIIRRCWITSKILFLIQLAASDTKPCWTIV